MTSLVLHVLVLSALPILREAKRNLPAKLTARLAAPKPAQPAPQQAEVPPPKPAPVIRPAPLTRAAPQPAPRPVPETAPIPGVEPAKQAAEPAFTVPAAPAAPSSPASNTARAEPAAAVPASNGVDAGTVAQFRLELMDLARRYKRYPRAAQDNNWEGRVELRIAIGEDGAISSLNVKKGAGRAVLDEEAQAMIRTAKSKAVIPPALRGKAFVLEIPVDFSLKD